MKVKLLRNPLIFFLLFGVLSSLSGQKSELALKLGGHLTSTTDYFINIGNTPYSLEYPRGRDIAPDFGVMYRYNGGLRWSLEIEGMYSNSILLYNVERSSILIAASVLDTCINSSKTLQIPIRYKYFVKPGLNVFGGLGIQIFIAEEIESKTIANEPELSLLLNNAKELINGRHPFIEFGAGLEVTSRISVDAKYMFVIGSIINNLEFENTSIQPDVKWRGAYVNISYRFLKI